MTLQPLLLLQFEMPLICHVEVSLVQQNWVLQNKKTLTSISVNWVIPEKISYPHMGEIEITPSPFPGILQTIGIPLPGHLGLNYPLPLEHP